MDLKPGDIIVHDSNYKCDKLIRNGEVAVLISPGYGGGWYSWTNEKNIGCLFDPYIVYELEKLGEDPDRNQMIKFAKSIEEYINQKYVDLYVGGADQLEIEWAPQRSLFKIKEYDGFESIEYLNDNLIVA